MKQNKHSIGLIIALAGLLLLPAGSVRAGAGKQLLSGVSSAPRADAAAEGAQVKQPVELNGDNVEYKADEGKFVASGNVVLHQYDNTLYCDRLEYYRDRQEAHASGSVVLISAKGTIWADRAFYNFQTKKGEFTNARFLASPFFGTAVTVSKINDNYYVMSDGFFSTSDYDDPEWRIKARRVDVYPGNRAVAHASTMYMGGIPVMYMPRYTKSLEKNETHITIIPGYKKAFGAYLLTAVRTNPVDGIETTYHLDYRELRYLAGGVDVKYQPTAIGQGLLRPYYLDERITGAHRGWESSNVPTIIHDRYRVEWRHQWNIDPSLSFVGQLYKLSDPDVVKTYFEREYRADQNPATYAVLTKVLPNLTASLRTDVRVNRFDGNVQRLPEANVTFNNQQIGQSGVYFKSTATASNLLQKAVAPADDVNHTIRLVSDNELSRPFKTGPVEWRPFVGTEETFYTRSLDHSHDNDLRTQWRAGTDLTTRFYRVYDVSYKGYGIEINKLRHVVVPSVSYLYAHIPTVSSDHFWQYDGVDARTQTDQAVLSVENILQTKHKEQSVDLFHSWLSAPYLFNDNVTGGVNGKLGDISLTNEFYPNSHLTLQQDATYSTETHRIQTEDIDLYLKDNKKWEFGIGQRFARGEADQITTQLTYKFNPKWRAVVYERMYTNNVKWQEQQYTLVRDLHSWEMEMSIRDKMHESGSGLEFWLMFRIKAFPSFSLQGSSSFSRAQAGAQAAQ